MNIQDTPLYRLEIVVPAADVDLFTALLFDQVQYGWEEEEGPESTMFRVHIDEKFFCDDLQKEIAESFPQAKVTYSEIVREEWALAWREFFNPVHTGETFVVVPPWMEDSDEIGSKEAIVIEPKTAFGTGHHPTTALCLTTLSELIKDDVVKKGQTFLDLGTGSGILGIGCARLGLTGLGLDIDPLAVDNAQENKELNKVSDNFEVRQGGIEGANTGPYDLVLANILAGPLVAMAPRMVPLVKRPGCLVLSGILEEQAQNVVAAYMAQGLEKPVIRHDGEWVALVWKL